TPSPPRTRYPTTSATPSTPSTTLDMRADLSSVGLDLAALGMPVGASRRGADAMVDGEQAAGVVAVLHLGETGVVVAPGRCLPVVLEIIGFGEVGGGPPGEGFERCHGGGDGPGVLASLRGIWLVAGDAGVGRGLVGSGDRQREGVQDRWVHRGVFRPVQDVVGGPGEAFVAMQGYRPDLAGPGE